MPRKPIDYSKTVIYGIFSNSSDENIYIGHTTDFSNRKRGHKSTCNNPNDNLYHLMLYKKIRDNGGWDNYTMRLIEEYPCNTRNEATAREFFYYQNFSTALNAYVPNRDKTNYYIENKHHLLQKNKEYRKNNKETIYKNNKTYCENNKEIVKQYKIKHYVNNKPRILQYQNEKVQCECGFIGNRNNLPRHKKTEKHAKIMESKTN